MNFKYNNNNKWRKIYGCFVCFRFGIPLFGGEGRDGRSALEGFLRHCEVGVGFCSSPVVRCPTPSHCFPPCCGSFWFGASDCCLLPLTSFFHVKIDFFSFFLGSLRLKDRIFGGDGASVSACPVGSRLSAPKIRSFLVCYCLCS